MVERLNHLGLLPDADQPSMTYEIKGHRYTAATDPPAACVLFITLRRTKILGRAGGAPDFGAFIFETPRRGFPLPEQWARPALLEKLRETGFMPSPNDTTAIALNGRAYNSELLEEDSLGSGGLGETPGIEPAEPAATILRSFGSNYVNCSSLSNGLSRAASGWTASAPGGSRLQRAAESAWTSSVKSPSLRTRHKATKQLREG
ncbi:hypothetical protein J2R80_008150 [Bradyrhizobium sp. USDA 4541]|nr:hypothetical protein [Bradyrhizobium sp. USDA 4541]